MKKINCISFLLLLCSSISLFAQPDTSGRYFPNRYKLDIPEEWKKTKIIEAISEILPQTLDEYIDSNKQLCLDCRAGLTIMLLMERPTFADDNETFQFSAALGLFDSTGKELIELSLVSKEEKHDVRVRAEYQPEPSAYRYKDVITEVIRGRNGEIVSIVKIPMSPPAITNNIPNYSREIPNLMKIAESRIYQIKDILANMKKTAARD